MPFKSDKQRRYLYSEKPEVARKFAMDSNKGSQSSAYAKAIREGSQQPKTKKKTGTTGAVGG
jgi:hemoglobin-like flavoprotein